MKRKFGKERIKVPEENIIGKTRDIDEAYVELDKLSRLGLINVGEIINYDDPVCVSISPKGEVHIHKLNHVFRPDQFGEVTDVTVEYKELYGKRQRVVEVEFDILER